MEKKKQKTGKRCQKRRWLQKQMLKRKRRVEEMVSVRATEKYFIIYNLTLSQDIQKG